MRNWLWKVLKAISWVSSSSKALWKFQVYLNEIEFLKSSLQVVFQNVGGSVNSFADCLATQGADRSIDRIALSM